MKIIQGKSIPEQQLEIYSNLSETTDLERHEKKNKKEEDSGCHYEFIIVTKQIQLIKKFLPRSLE